MSSQSSIAVFSAFLFLSRLFNFHSIFILLVLKNLIQSDLRPDRELNKKALGQGIKCCDLLVHGQMVPSASSADDQKLITLDGCITIIDFDLRHFSLMEEAVRNLSDFREEAVEMIDFDLLRSMKGGLHIQI